MHKTFLLLTFKKIKILKLKPNPIFESITADRNFNFLRDK